MSQFIDTTIREGVLHVTLNRPDKKNALDAGMYQALADTLTDADKNSSVRAIYLSSSSDAFCSGNDLNDFLEDPPGDITAPVFQFIQAIAYAEKPIVAAVSGLAVGIGTTMLLHCDLVYADETARFMTPFVQLGVCAEAGSSLLLPRLLGQQKAAEVLLCGESFDATQAKDAGFVSQIFDSENLQNQALEKANLLAGQPVDALISTKRLIRAPLKEQLEQAIRAESAEFMRLLNEEDSQRIMSSFFER